MNVAPSTAAEGTCASCSSPLAAGQRYCLGCGERRAELPPPFRPPERETAAEAWLAPPLLGVQARAAPPLLGARRSFGAVGTVVLACGVLIGAAVGPALTPASLAATAGQIIVVSTDAVGAAGAVASGSGADGSAGASGGLVAPTGNVAAPPNRVVDRGGGSAPAPATAATVVPSTPSAPTDNTPAAPQTPPTPQAPSEDPTVAGTVIHLSHSGHGYTVATKEGELIALHTAKEPALGDKVKTTVKPLDNGTFAQLKAKVSGHLDSATFHGTVTFADDQSRTYTVSAPGVSLLVHMPPPAQPAPTDPAAQPAPPPAAVPAAGSLTTVDVRIVQPADPNAPPQLQETHRKDGDPATGDLDLEGIVRAPDPAAPPDPSHLIVSADDAGESPATLSVKVPPKFDVSKLKKPGTVISALVTREADGSYTFVSATDDTTQKSASQPAG